MKVLFDASTPRRLAASCVVTISCGLTNWVGRVWRTGTYWMPPRQPDSTSWLTCDQNIRYQQNLTGRKLALLVLSSNHWPTLRRVASRIATAVDFVQSGQIARVDVPKL